GPGEGDPSGADSGRHDDLVEPGQVVAAGLGAEPYVDAEHLESTGEVAHGLAEVLLAGNLHRVAELAADDLLLLEEGHRAAALGGADGRCETGRSGAHHGDRRTTTHG